MSLYSDIFLLYLYRKIEKNGIKKIWSLCRVHREKHSAKVAIRGIPKKATLPSARSLTLGKVWNFAECQPAGIRQSFKLSQVPNPGTRQSFGLCRVPAIRHSANAPSAAAPTWQICRGSRQPLCRVPEKWQSAKTLLPSGALPSVTGTRQRQEVR